MPHLLAWPDADARASPFNFSLSIPPLPPFYLPRSPSPVMDGQGACGLERSRPKLPTWDRCEWSKLNPDQCTSWGRRFVALLKWLLSGLNTKHGIMARSARHEDHIIRLQAGWMEEEGGWGGVHAHASLYQKPRLSQHNMNYNGECFTAGCRV